MTLLLRPLGLRLARYAELPITLKHLQYYDYFHAILEQLVQVPGSVVECGFGYGNSFVVLGALSQKFDRPLLGLDTFNGFPEPSQLDQSKRNPRAGEWAVRTAVEAAETCRLAGLGDAMTTGRIRLLQSTLGSGTRNPIPTEKIAMLHLDLDLHDSYSAALRLFWDQLSSGGLVILDEYHATETWPGCRVAVDKFVESHGDAYLEPIAVGRRQRYALRKGRQGQ